MIYVLRQWKDGQVSGLLNHLERNGVAYEVLEAYSLEEYPLLRQGDAVIGLGGPPSVCKMRDPNYECRFLLDEELFIAEAEAAGIPFLGICLSHQLRAVMAGQEVRSGRHVFAMHEVRLTAAGERHWLFDGLPPYPVFYQNHGDYVTGVPRTAELLATSDTCAVEAVAWNDRSVSTQFHPEVLGSQIEGAVARFPKAMAQHGLTLEGLLASIPPDYDAYTARMFDNFL